MQSAIPAKFARRPAEFAPVAVRSSRVRFCPVGPSRHEASPKSSPARGFIIINLIEPGAAHSLPPLSAKLDDFEPFASSGEPSLTCSACRVVS
jgi:hypothetical protein